MKVAKRGLSVKVDKALSVYAAGKVRKTARADAEEVAA